MKQNQQRTPIYTKLTQFNKENPISFHVPGHKNGLIFPDDAREDFQNLLALDVTELVGLDDLHAPNGIIAEAEGLAASFFDADHTFFLIGGSTEGNVAMILATCTTGEKVIVQRNSHKSIINGLELRGATPIFIAPEYDYTVDRYTSPGIATLKQALYHHPDAKAVVLTYPDYFGKTYPIKEMIELAHTYHIPVLVDEAHGVHFSLGTPFPPSALVHGADIVVQSAHKMAPAMTMSAYLHINAGRIAKERVAHYLQMLQSSSPSYPLMASLDIARSFLAMLTPADIEAVEASAYEVRKLFEANNLWDLLPVTESDDLLKLTLQIKPGLSAQEIAHYFEQAGIYPELATHNQLLFIHGLKPFQQVRKLERVIKSMTGQLKKTVNHATIDVTKLFPQKIETLVLSYQEMDQQQVITIPLAQAIGRVAAEAVIPYPPGIPLIVRGMQVTGDHIIIIQQLAGQGVTIQHHDRTSSIRVFTG